MKKNKIWKRAGAVILSTALLFGTLPTGVMAEETVGQDTNEEELLSEEVVSEDEPAETILPEEVSLEEEVEDTAEMDSDTAEAESEVSESTAETGESETDLQYHFTEGDVASILTWKEQYFSEGYEQLLAQDESWWDGLYDYERDLAEFLVSIAPDISEQVYLGQDLEQCLEILDTGVSAQDFFRGTVFDGLEKEDLQALQQEGGSLEALAETAEENPQIVALLRNEAVKTSPIANYVYFYWLRTHTTVGTPAGEKVQRGEYSDEASPRIRAIEVWNDMVRQCCVLRPKLVELGAVPDYCSAIFEPANLFGL